MTHPLAPLHARAQWVIVKLVPLPNGATDKIPMSVTGAAIDAHDPQHWLGHAAATGAAALWGPSFIVGFVLTAADPFWCLDIDKCAQPDGTWSPLALRLIQALPGAAVEVSQSGRGLHVWGQGPVPEHSKKNTALKIELYTERRFIAIGTGAVGAMAPVCPGIAAVAAEYFPPRLASAVDAPDTGPRSDWRGPEDDDELLRRALAAQSMANVFGSAASFREVWEADAQALGRYFPGNSDEPFDASSADMSLASRLAFWTGCDVARIERLMRRSALARDKWDERADYLVDRTIRTACSQCKDVYRDPRAVVPVQATPAAVDTQAKPAAARGNLQAANWGSAALQHVQDGVRETGLIVGLDRFTMRRTVKIAPGSPYADALPNLSAAPRDLEEEDNAQLRDYMQRLGFKQIAAAAMTDALSILARQNAYDSAFDYGNRLVWDGVPRIDRFMVDYLGCADTLYSRALGAYLWTAMAGRMLSPGCKADMIPILVGGQGVGKSTLVKALVENPEHFCEVDFDRDEVDLIRQTSGRLICEIAELAGMSRKDRRAVKAWASRTVDEYVPKFVEGTRRIPRRFLAIGTTNETEFLTDVTGERRWLPITVGTILLTMIERDRAQLWAEGVARFRANGVEWQAAQQLARAEHDRYTVSDEWADPVADWLEANPGAQRISDVFAGALKRAALTMTWADERRLADVLRRLGRVKETVRINGKPTKAWIIPAPPAPL